MNTSNFHDSVPSFDLPIHSPAPGNQTPPDQQPAPVNAQKPDEVIERVERHLDQIDEDLLLVDYIGSEEDFHFPALDYVVPNDFLLSIVIPVFNEQETILSILRRVAAIPLPKEILIVDDYSIDDTRKILAELEKATDVRVFYHAMNQGKGASLRTGFQEAKGDVVVIQDADLEYDPRDIPKLVQPIVQGDFDVVYGSRYLGDAPQDPSALHRFGNALLTKASNFFTRLKLTDMETCYKAFRRHVLRSVPLKQDRFGFEPEITAKLARRRVRLKEIPIRYHARGYEEGKKIGLRDAVNAFWCIVRYGVGD